MPFETSLCVPEINVQVQEPLRSQGDRIEKELKAHHVIALFISV